MPLHVLSDTFTEGIVFSDVWNNALSIDKNLVATDAQLWLLHRYETDYGIFNHDAPSDPNSCAELRQHYAEDLYAVNNALKIRMEEYLIARVGEVFKISFVEFINQPRQVVTDMLELGLKYKAVTENTTSDIITKLRNEMDRK